MKSDDIKSIDDVIDVLDAIIKETESGENPLGYFAVLYQKVTLKVKEGIENNFFDDGERMEKLDVLFAQRYFDAYFAWKKETTITDSWKVCFENSEKYWSVVLQHLLLGMNAHINLDLGIAAVETARGGNIEDLKGDFMKINDILSSLVNEVQSSISKIWPLLGKILKLTGKIDDYLVDFSMELARDGAWEFALELSSKNKSERTIFIEHRDKKVAQKADLVLNPGKMAKFILKIIRLGERGSVAQKMGHLLH